MGKLPICRVCLVENVRMYVIVNKNLRELYEKLSGNPFVTEDCRPMLACFFCCTKLKQCYQFQRKCLESEELFAQMMNGDYEPNPLINQDQPEFCTGFIQTPIVHISIVDECQTESFTVKEELPAVCERLDDNIEPKEEHQSDELELENQENSFSVVEDISAQHSESDSEENEPLMEFKIEVEEHEVLRKKPKLEDVITEEQKKNEQSDTKVICKIDNCMFKTITKCKESFTKRGVNHFSLDTNGRNKAEIKCVKSNKAIVSDFINRQQRLCVNKKSFKCEICQHSFNRNYNLIQHIRKHTGEKPYTCDVCQRAFKDKFNLTRHMLTHTGVNPFKCDVCQRAFREKYNLTTHIRTHTGEKPFKCDVCQRCFSEKSSLSKHIRTHTGEKPYKCDICQGSFNYKRTLKRHTRVHAGEKPFKCYFCQRGFSEKSNLTTHIRTHTGEKPYKCDKCQSSFSQKGTLTKHIRAYSHC